MTQTSRSSVLLAALCSVVPFTAQSADVPLPVQGALPAGTYTLDKAHASLLFRVNHLGFSHWTARFSRFDASARFDPSKPAADQLTVTIDPTSINADNLPDGFLGTLQGPKFLDAGKFPQMSYRSTRVEPVGANGLRIYGELTLHGVTKPVVLDATYNGGYLGHPLDPHARAGFSARGTLKRADFGISFGIPEPGSTMGVGDAVEFAIEAEFSGPAWAGAPTNGGAKGK
jgi:polyisoprenoid-binding protein YceI